MGDELLTEREVSTEHKIAEGTLRNWRYSGRGPKYLRLEGNVRYRRSDIEKWLATCERGVTDGP